MTHEDPNAPTGSNQPRRSPRQGIGGSPVGSTLSIVLAVVAVVAGFLILRNITDDGGGSSNSGGATESTTPDSISSASSTTPPTTEPQIVTEGATVVVANASGVSQSAGAMTDELAAVGFEMGEATNATSSGFTASVVYFDPAIPAAEDVADSVAISMGDLTVETMPSEVPVEGGDLAGAGVLVMLGTNEAGKTLEELAPPENVSAPDPSGGATESEQPATETTTG